MTEVTSVSPPYHKKTEQILLTALIELIRLGNDGLLFTELAAFTLVQLSAETLLDQIMQTVAQRFQLHVVDDLINESVLQEQTGFTA